MRQWLDPGRERAESDWGRLGFPMYGEMANLPVEQLTARLASDAEAALSSPERYFDQLLALAGTNYREQVGHYRKQMAKHRQQMKSYERKRAEAPVDQDLIDLRTELNARIQTRLDTFQARAEAAWRKFLLVASMFLSGAVALISVLAIMRPAGNTGRQVLFYVPSAGLLGGFFAGFWRDLIAVVEKGRK